MGLKPDLEKMEAEKGVKRLLRTLKYYEDYDVRYRATEALRKIGWQPKNDEEEALYNHVMSGKSVAEPAIRPPSKPQKAFPIVTSTHSTTAKATSSVDLKTFTNSIDMEFILIQAGEFYMGSPSNEADRNINEGPVHHVKISNAFYMGKYEVMQKQWRNVMGNNPSDFKGDNLPVEQVSWDDVQDFIKKLNGIEGGGKYRLPTESEWEYASRADTKTRYSFGDDESPLGDYAWYTGYSGAKTHNVGQKKPNPWGLYDMYGNVWEWVQDIYHRNSYSGAPTDGTSWDGGDDYDGDYRHNRVFRGGCWLCSAGECRSARRSYGGPGTRDFRNGFRLLMAHESINHVLKHSIGIKLEKESLKQTQYNVFNVLHWIEVGTLAGEQCRYQEAIACFNNVIEIDPNNAIAWKCKAAALLAIANFSGALYCVDRSLAIKFDNEASQLREMIIQGFPRY